jgi:hypothetical protein
MYVCVFWIALAGEKKKLIDDNSYMIYINRNPILWLGISVYGGGVLSVYFSIDEVQQTTFFVM